MSVASAFKLPILAYAFLGTALVACTDTTTTRQVYSNIEVHPETTDAGGVELEWRSGAGRDRVLMVICEGGCRGAEAVSVSREKTGLTLLWRDPLGEPEQPPERFSFRKIGSDLVVEHPAWATGQALKRVANPAPGRTSGWAAY